MGEHIKFMSWEEAVYFLSSFFVIIILPCFAVGVLGWRMINELSHYPSKTPRIQLGIFFKLLLIESVTFVLLLLFYHIYA